MMSKRQPVCWCGELRRDEPLARHTSWRVGGTADRYYLPRDVDDLALFLADLPPDEPVFWLGLGSNLLVRDGGIRGTVICTSGMLNGLTRPDEHRLRVESGVACAKVARFAAHEALSGSEFLVGIPGTMGGALAMNAGAFGGETWTLVESVETLDRRGQRHLRGPEDYEVGYREVRGPEGEWFVAAVLVLTPGDRTRALAHIKDLLAQRGASQPSGQPSGGSVFRNPPGDYAGRLIEACGLKGHAIGGARVSEKHANFIINDGSATAGDIEALIRHVAETVAARQKVRLKTEVHIVGEAP